MDFFVFFFNFCMVFIYFLLVFIYYSKVFIDVYICLFFFRNIY